MARPVRSKIDVKTLGMIGGVGPESTVEYYQTIIRLYRARAGDRSYPQFIINSINLKTGIDLFTADDLGGAARFLAEEIHKLARAGADFGLISANTPHLVFDEVQAAVPIPLISIVEATCAVAKARGFKRLALFGTRFTMQGTFYPKVFVREGVELVIPNAEDQLFIHDKYMNELVLGKFLPETRAGLLAIVDRLKAERNIEAVILAGTELPLILRDAAHNGVPLLDTMRIHAEAAVDNMFL
jgi:aspartate racemase